MRLTTARYYTPSGRSIQALGISPDIEVQPAKVEEIQQGLRRREADLRGALRNDTPNSQPARPAPQAVPPAPAPAPRPLPRRHPAPGAQAPQGEEGDPATAAAQPISSTTSSPARST